MPIVTLDFETAYSQEYSLSKMSEIDYVLDARYETIMCSVKEGNGPADYFVGHDAVANRFSRIDWSRTAMLAHNNRFDGSILAWRFGIVPAMYLDTLGMARALTHAVVGSSSLAKVADYLGLKAKGTAVYNMRGKWLTDFTQSDLEVYGEYCCHDNELCKTIFDTFTKVFPRSELALIDSVLRMFIQPQVKLDPAVLALYQAQLQASKAATMARVASIDPAVFSSNVKFAALLESYGLEVPTKISKTTGMEAYALARNDRAFKELCEDDSLPDEVQTILAARIQSKSTMEEKRTERLFNLAVKSWVPEVPPVQPDWQDPTVGWAPVPLRYYGAHTGRFSGDGGFNWQNFKRKSMIRAAVKAPPGMRIVHRDSSQIEARMVAWLADCGLLLEAFREGRDVYSEFATTFYRRTVRKSDTLERFVGKTSILGLGYGMGWERFVHTLFIGSGGISVTLDEAEGKRLVYHYRGLYAEIPDLWKAAERMLADVAELSAPWIGGYPEAQRSPRLSTVKPFPAVIQPGLGALWLPNGLPIAYPGLRRERRVDGSHQWLYDGPYQTIKTLFGGKVVENVSQALARIVLTDITLRVRQQHGIIPFLSTHDSLDYCVPEADAESVDAMLAREFAIPPAWAPNLPLASEGGWGSDLLKAELATND